MSGSKQDSDLVGDLLAPVPRATLVRDISSALDLSEAQAREIVAAFDQFVARPLEQNLRKFRGRELAKRNPMIYTLRGTETVDDWVDRLLADRETSAIESHLGTFLEEVARIVSGGVKPGNGWISK